MTPAREMMELARKCAVLVADPTEGSIASGILAGEYDDWPLVQVALRAIATQQAEIARLREALRKISNIRRRKNTWAEDVAERMKNIARAALEQKP